MVSEIKKGGEKMDVEHELNSIECKLKKIEASVPVNGDTVSIFHHIENIRQGMKNVDRGAKNLREDLKLRKGNEKIDLKLQEKLQEKAVKVARIVYATWQDDLHNTEKHQNFLVAEDLVDTILEGG